MVKSNGPAAQFPACVGLEGSGLVWALSSPGLPHSPEWLLATCRGLLHEHLCKG